MERAIERLRYLVAEDEPPQRQALEALLAELWPQAELCASCANGLEALEAAERERPHAAFLDLRMPGLGGLEVAKRLARSVHVVFVTAHDDAAVGAFEHGAVDYVLKPPSRERLALTLERLRERLGRPPGPALDRVIEDLRPRVGAAPTRAAMRWITATVRDAVKLYSIDEVLAFHAQDKYTRVLTASDEALIRSSLRELAQGLDSDVFWQVHRSVIVRAAAIDSVRRDELGRYALTLKGRRDVLPVSSAFGGRLRGM